jgi:hypothetical protein
VELQACDDPAELPPDRRAFADQAARDIRAVDFNRAGFPPGGFLGGWSRLESASRISSMETVFFAPGMARKDGHDVTAAASDAQDARMARFSARDKVVSLSTSRGWSKTEPGCKIAFKS